MSCRIYVSHEPIPGRETQDMVRSLMGKLGCHPSPHLKVTSSTTSTSFETLDYVWRDPCLYRVLAENSNHSSESIQELEAWFFSQDLNGQDENLNVLIGFTIDLPETGPTVSEVYFQDLPGAENSRFLLQMIILFLTHDLRATRIRAMVKHATEPFFDYSNGTVKICKIPGWSFKIPADDEYGPTADRDPWV